VGKAVYIENPLKAAWRIVKHTHSLVDTVLTFEAALNASFPSDKKYSFSERNNTILKQYSIEYAKSYHDRMNNMVEKQMRSAILEIGSFLYSAWVDAGQPVLRNLIKLEPTPDEKKTETDTERKYEKGVPLGREI